MARSQGNVFLERGQAKSKLRACQEVSHAAQRTSLWTTVVLTFVCLHRVPDSAPNDVIVFQVSSAKIRLASPDQWLRQLRLLCVQNDPVTLCASRQSHAWRSRKASRSAPRKIEKSVSMDRVRTAVDGVPVEANPRTCRKECSRRAITDKTMSSGGLKMTRRGKSAWKLLNPLRRTA